MILFLMMALQGAPTAAAPVPAWTAIMKPDSQNGKPTGQASAISTDGTSRLVIRCDRRTDDLVSLQFIPNPSFSPTTSRPVSIAVDGGNMQGANWDFLQGALIMSDDVIVTNLAVLIAGARHAIRVRVIDPTEKPIDMTFPAPASDAGIKQILQTCNYSFGVAPSSLPAPAPAP